MLRNDERKSEHNLRIKRGNAISSSKKYKTIPPELFKCGNLA